MLEFDEVLVHFFDLKHCPATLLRNNEIVLEIEISPISIENAVTKLNNVSRAAQALIESRDRPRYRLLLRNRHKPNTDFVTLTLALFDHRQQAVHWDVPRDTTMHIPFASHSCVERWLTRFPQNHPTLMCFVSSIFGQLAMLITIVGIVWGWFSRT